MKTLTQNVGHPRSLSDLSDRSEPGRRARTVLHDFEAHCGTTQREIGQNELASFGASQKWTALPTGAVDQPQVRQAPGLRAGTQNVQCITNQNRLILDK